MPFGFVVFVSVHESASIRTSRFENSFILLNKVTWILFHIIKCLLEGVE